MGRDFSLTLDANHETMSGASPWYTTSDSAGEPLVALSGASGIYDERSEVSLGASYYSDNGTLSGAVGYSEENDYRATYYAVSGSRNFNDQLTTLSFGYSYSSDDVFTTDALRFNRVLNESKHSKSGVFSVSQVINPISPFQLSLNVSEQSGFLNDPYKLRDIRPRDKTQIAVTNSYRRFMIDNNAALHINYRYYHDDFGINSASLSLTLRQKIGDQLILSPSFRFYRQSSADFYNPRFDVGSPIQHPDLTPSNYSADFRLSEFDSFTYGVKFNYILTDNFKFIHGDIRSLRDCQLACKNVDYVLHQAAIGSVPRSIEDPIYTNQANIDGFLNMLVASRDAKVKRFVYAASSSSYGDNIDLPKVENIIGNPLSPYAVTKYVNELYANVFANNYEFKAIGLRYFNIFGKRQDPEGAYAAVIPIKGAPLTCISLIAKQTSCNVFNSTNLIS